MIDVKRILLALSVVAVVVVATQPLDAAEVQRGVKAQLFSRWDLDGDGKLTPEEWRGAAPFEEVDADGDGVITSAELAAVSTAVVSQPRPKAGRPGGPEAETDEWTDGLYDWKGSSSRTRYTSDARRSKDPAEASPVNLWDRDGDGKVSRQEWIGGDADWDRLDLDEDGFITAEEYTTAQAAAVDQRSADTRKPDGQATGVDPRTAGNPSGEGRKTLDPSLLQGRTLTRPPGVPAVVTPQDVDGDELESKGEGDVKDEDEGEDAPESD